MMKHQNRTLSERSVLLMTSLARRVLKVDRLLAFAGRQRFSGTLKKWVARIPMASQLFYLVYYGLLHAMIVQRKAGPLWSVRIPGGSKLLTPDLDDALGHIEVIWRTRIYDKYVPKEGDIVIDAEAHIGIYTTRASRLVGDTGTVVAIEPHPANYDYLEKNLCLNGCRNVIPVRAALASRCGETTLFLGTSSVGHSTVLTKDVGSVSALSITLDQLVADLGLATVYLIKANVEGTMIELLNGAEDTLTDLGPRIVTTVDHYSTEREEVSDFLRARGFTVSVEGGVLCAELQYQRPVHPNIPTERG